MTKEAITMSQKEVDRWHVIQRTRDTRGYQATAVRQLGLSVRQVQRQVQRYRSQGAAGLVSRRRGQRPPNALASAVRAQAVAVVRERYPDCAPTLAHEKLTAQPGYTFSVETLRQWLIAAGVWQPTPPPRMHPRRPRRPCVGEYRRLVALYSDQHSIFRINQQDCEGERTPFTRALETLDIAPIHAHTPQATGRVERAHQPLQDRLVKELRLHGLSTLAAANAGLPTFWADYNRRFAVTPASPVEAHRPVRHSPPDLARIFALQHSRIISKTLSVQFQNRTSQLQGQGRGYRLRGAPVTVCEAFDGSSELLHEGRALPYRLLTADPAPIPVETEKPLALRLATIQQAPRRRPRSKPAPAHPWRRPLRPPLASPPAPYEAPNRKGTFLNCRKGDISALG